MAAMYVRGGGACITVGSAHGVHCHADHATQEGQNLTSTMLLSHRRQDIDCFAGCNDKS